MNREPQEEALPVGWKASVAEDQMAPGEGNWSAWFTNDKSLVDESLSPASVVLLLVLSGDDGEWLLLTYPLAAALPSLYMDVAGGRSAASGIERAAAAGSGAGDRSRPRVRGRRVADAAWKRITSFSRRRSPRASPVYLSITCPRLAGQSLSALLQLMNSWERIGGPRNFAAAMHTTRHSDCCRTKACRQSDHAERVSPAAQAAATQQHFSHCLRIRSPAAPQPDSVCLVRRN